MGTRIETDTYGNHKGIRTHIGTTYGHRKSAQAHIGTGMVPWQIWEAE